MTENAVTEVRPGGTYLCAKLPGRRVGIVCFLILHSGIDSNLLAWETVAEKRRSYFY
jgi:hypothetical protein